jgi:protein tyrosine phosphatase (PTP) superfamily phosphohydrolase (DUF442 family)
MGIEDIAAFIGVSDRLALGGQPTEAQLGELRGAGFEILINLGLSGQAYSLPNEGATARALGLEYHHIPVEFGSPTAQDLDEFIVKMDACENRKVFVHCAANYRVSCFVSLYMRLRHGWSSTEAEQLVTSVWNPDETWRKFIENNSARFCLDRPQVDAQGELRLVDLQ